eukprot:c32046_g1_i1 orf=3-197(-)
MARFERTLSYLVHSQSGGAQCFVNVQGNFPVCDSCLTKADFVLVFNLKKQTVVVQSCSCTNSVEF